MVLGLSRASEREVGREAILSMPGSFQVLFNFKETVRFDPEYVLRPASQSEVTEVVLVTEHRDDRITLSHLMLFNGRVFEHWHQIWTFEDRTLTEFQGGERWAERQLPEEAVAGTWSQLVAGRGQGPRYESHAPWRREDGILSWHAEAAARPQPLRDAGRTDYQILETVNRISLTPDGWTHEQDSAKKRVVEGKPALLVREAGLNYYDRVPTEKMDAFWREALPVWRELATGTRPFVLRTEVDGKSLWDRLNELAQDESVEDVGAAIREVIAGYRSEEE